MTARARHGLPPRAVRRRTPKPWHGQPRSGLATAKREARAEAERQTEKVERFDYGRTMQVAHQEWRANNVSATLALLDSTRPDLRGWEWRYVDRLCHSELLTLKGHTGHVEFGVVQPRRVADRDRGLRSESAEGSGTRGRGAEILTLEGATVQPWINGSGRTLQRPGQFSRDWFADQ